MTDIFRFWQHIDPTATIHPADEPVFARLKGKHGFDLKCLPLNFAGPLKTAPVVLLYLSPGLGKNDRRYARTKAGQDHYAAQRSGGAELPGDPSALSHKWRESRLKVLGDWQNARDKIATMNIGAYHSKSFVDHDVLASLPSSRVALDWAQSVLFPEAEAGKRVVVCMRSARYWGLRAGETYGRSLFAPDTVRGGHMRKGSMRDKIVQAAREALS